MPDAVLTGVETRTSSPDPHQRATTTCRASTCAACIPAGEGAGYAGGILSAAVDGIRSPRPVAVSLTGGDATGLATRRGRLDARGAVDY